MRVFKTTYNDKQGRTKQAAKWYIEFIGLHETVHRLPAFTSKSASEEVMRNIGKLVGYSKASGGQVDPSLSTWLAGLPVKMRDTFVRWGILPAERVAVAKPLADHLNDFHASIKAKGSTTRHADLVTGRARRVMRECSFKFYGDIRADRVMTFLSELQQDKVTLDEAGEIVVTKRGISAQTFNFHQAAVKQFCRWMVKERRALENPVSHLDGLNVRTDRRVERRALTGDELRALLDMTANGPFVQVDGKVQRVPTERNGMAPEDRVILYRVAVETGLRSSELRSLTRASFDLGGKSPCVTVKAGYSKRRRDDTLPLRPGTAIALRGFLANKAPATPVFKMPVRFDVADMLRVDLIEAGIAPTDSEGRVVDFHALRHTFITGLASGGVHPKTAQALARHSTITLTMDRYTHTHRGDEAAALNVLPNLDDETESVRATGTDDAVMFTTSAIGNV